MSEQSMAGLLLMEEEELDDIPVELPPGPLHTLGHLLVTASVRLGGNYHLPIIPPQGFADMGIRAVQLCRINEIDSPAQRPPAAKLHLLRQIDYCAGVLGLGSQNKVVRPIFCLTTVFPKRHLPKHKNHGESPPSDPSWFPANLFRDYCCCGLARVAK